MDVASHGDRESTHMIKPRLWPAIVASYGTSWDPGPAYKSMTSGETLRSEAPNED